MDSSRRAVESYWRSRMIEGATSDEDKVAPVYKLEEICELLRSSHVSIVKEVSEFILKRLNHKSPIVKQKALRLIKYSVGKSGVEFRREMQRHSTAVRQLFHYKGQVDPLKGDALNKAVRDTAHETISAIFASEDDKPSPAEDLNRRIEGFGNTNYEIPSDDKKSFLSEVVDIGSASIKLGLSSITAAQSLRKSDSGSYRGPVLKRSLTTEIDAPDRYERFENHSETRGASASSKNASGGTWGQDSRMNVVEMTNGDSSSSRTANKSREERLLETIVTAGGVRLQPSRDALQVFLVEASKLDAVALSRALELKLQSHLWQVRMKAVCVLEALLRKKDDTHFAIIGSYFSDCKDAVLSCSESPQASLREKANKVLSLLDGEQISGANHFSEKSSTVKPERMAVVQMPDLIDTGDSDDYFGTDDATNKQSETSATNLMTSTRPVIDDLFGDSSVTDISANGQKNEEDPFADVSFHSSNEDKPQVDDIFSGLTIDDKQSANGNHVPVNKNRPEAMDIFGPSFEPLQELGIHKNGVHDLVGGLSNNETPFDMKSQGVFAGATSNAQPNHQVPNTALNDIFSSQMTGMNQNAMFPMGPMQYNMPPNIMFNQALASQPINYGAMGTFLAQQQLLATMSNFQPMGNFSAQANAGVDHFSGNNSEGALPDIFNPNIPVQTPSTMLNNSKKEETKAFDFISEHLSAVRDPKRVV
ncbi:hypothetical protein AQUCO_00100336v1 [Aquilegia coerulea]|uniref:VHS domain-containing protein n=1 Tax=Aquilegia coerulea TaxID=218851 RepID=A0A2G5F9V8_AQUCA|nr:hypothetical protein AQUCO_00100336v1 [Aquilegia coerulea]PIA64793.1 hypothetical protein AQUCO_00100336v1 [Aquilegia coerulea]